MDTVIDRCNTEKYRAGMLARSKAGHDTGKIYVIIDVDDTYVYLADGNIRTLDHLKKKKKKHVQIIYREYHIADADDVEIKRILKMDASSTRNSKELVKC